MESRRAFLGRCGAGAAAWTALGAGGWSSLANAAEFEPSRFGELGAFAMERAKAAGASYADIRINRYRTQYVMLRVQADRATGKPVEVPMVTDNGSFGFGLRVLADGAWGFSASYEVTREAIARAAAEAVEIAKANAPLRREPVRLAATPSYRDTYSTKVVTDPFSVPIEDKLALLRSAAEQARKVSGVFSVMGNIEARLEDRFFVSTEGSVIEQHVYQIAPQITATAVQSGRKVKSRYYRPHSVSRGTRPSSGPAWSGTPIGSARRPSRTWQRPRSHPESRTSFSCRPISALTIHESIGHSTELDRALGYEANYAGTSFLSTDKLGKFRVGSEIVNFNGDRTRPESLSTCGYDDDGVKTRQFPIIKAGIFVGYQTIRDQAHLIGQSESMGCCYADSYASVPFQRMPNVWLEPSDKPVTLEDLISGVEDGILIDGRGSYSIDQQRYNFQFGGDAFWEIKGGKVRGMIADVAYQSRTPDFWASCDGIGGQALWENVGLDRDGKGQPGQINAMSHGCAPARFRRINVLRTG